MMHSGVCRRFWRSWEADLRARMHETTCTRARRRVPSRERFNSHEHMPNKIANLIRQNKFLDLRGLTCLHNVRTIPPMTAPKLTLSQHQIRAIAVAASCDPRTVVKVLQGKRVQAMPLMRIRAAVTQVMGELAKERGT